MASSNGASSIGAGSQLFDKLDSGGRMLKAEGSRFSRGALASSARRGNSANHAMSHAEAVDNMRLARQLHTAESELEKLQRVLAAKSRRIDA